MILSIKELNQAKDNQLDFEFDEQVKEINLVSPALAKLTVKKTGEGFININGTIKAKLNAVCDNCLKEYIQEIDCEIDENFAENTLYEEYGEETEIKDGFFAVDLFGSGEIDLSDLIYQSLILAIPNKFVCGINCMGGDLSEFIKGELPDPRLEIFKQIKTEKE